MCVCVSLSLLEHLHCSYSSHSSPLLLEASPLPAMFELHSVPTLEHADGEKCVSLSVLLFRDTAFCELCPSLVAAPELPYDWVSSLKHLLRFFFLVFAGKIGQVILEFTYNITVCATVLSLL